MLHVSFMLEQLESDSMVQISSVIVGPHFFEDDADHAVTVSAQSYKLCWEVSCLMSWISVTYQYVFNKMGPLFTLHEEAWQFCTGTYFSLRGH
jgi:hypothetical protein